tara:strand:- start:613 stop:840 length:228 start_codon:yes stop_codon:yes gene_type:complete
VLDGLDVSQIPPHVTVLAVLAKIKVVTGCAVIAHAGEVLRPTPITEYHLPIEIEFELRGRRQSNDIDYVGRHNTI